MPPVSVRAEQRRRRQAETLAKMLADVEAYIAAFDQEQGQRELTSAEQTELDALKVRRQRIADSISEASSARPSA